MIGNLQLLLWLALVVGGIGAMQFGASRASDSLDAYACRAGMGGAVAGALLGIATAAPEISVNIASVAFGWPDLGLGAALGSNVPALPLIFLLSWLSLRSARKSGEATRAPALKPTSVGAAAVQPPLPVVAPAAVGVQAFPYLLIVLLLAVLTLPHRWAGLQPLDALILLAAWAVYLARALLRPRKASAQRPAADEAPLSRALVGVPAIALGALASVVAARRLADAFGASDLVVGLFVIGLLCALPESFAAWRLAREGKTTTAVSTAMADGIVSLTVALAPPALTGAAVGDPALYLVNLIFLAFVLLAYIVLNHFGRGQELGPSRVLLFVGAYAVYLVAVVFLLAR